MKKASRRALILSMVYVCTFIFLFAFLNTFNVFAASDGDYVAEVNSVKYENYEEAWSAALGGGTVTMLKDWNINSVLTVKENKTVTVNMNGFMINRGLSSGKKSGAVFLVESGAVLNITGEKNSVSEHMGTIQNDIWHYNANGNYAINGALITGGYNSNGGGAIHIEDDAQVTLKNVTIAGNATSSGSGGGAIRMHSDGSKLTVIDSEICYNKATNGGGGAISVYGDGTDVKITGTKITNNKVTDSCDSGGAIYISDGKVTISSSSEISFNTATEYGGAIYISSGDLILDDTTIIARNTAVECGGAIYVDSGAKVVSLQGVFSGNRAEEKGGAIYVNSNVSGEIGTKISNAALLGNQATQSGGAIFVDSDDDISLYGKVVANGNSPNNLYIQKASAIVKNELTDGSRVGITTSWDANKTSPVYTSNYKYFVSDKMGYGISGDGSSLYYTSVSVGAQESITVGGSTYPVFKGTFQYSPNSGGQSTGYYFYSDGYFVDSAKYYNEHLSALSASVAVAAVNSVYEGEYTEAKGARNIIKVFEESGFKGISIHYPYPSFYGEDYAIISTIGYIIGSKDITVDGKTQTLIAIAVRGGKYGEEWASNVILGDGVGEAAGFDDAACQVEEGIYEYLNDYEIDPNAAKFWITGFSRAAATSNLVAKRLTDVCGEDNVYAYCFETPKGGVYSLLNDGLSYSNIHNIINTTDIVPFVGTGEMGFIRYGVDHIIPSYTVGSQEYLKQKEKMLSQLASIAPNAVFNDYFHEATVSYVLFTIQGWFSDEATLIKEESFPEFYTAAEWHYYLIKRMQEYSLTNDVEDSIYNKDSQNWHGYRNYWSSYKWYLYEDGNGNLLIKCYDKAPDDFDSGKYTSLTIEKSIYTVLSFYFGMDDSKKDAIIGAINLEKITSKIDMSDIYSDIIGEWNGFSIEEKNAQFNKYWKLIDLEASLAGILTNEEMKDLKSCLFVLIDFGLDFVGDDYDFEEQDLIGTLVYNISSIMQTHNYEILCAWTRSYDSFYASGDLVSPPIAPSFSLEGGTYNESIVLQLSVDNKNVEIYYTLDSTVPSAKNGIKYNASEPIRLNITDGKPTVTTVKAVCVYNGLSSEVVTYNYFLDSNAEIAVYDDIIHVYNFDGEARLVLAEYDSAGLLKGIECFVVTDNHYFSLSNSTLNFENRVVAYLIRDFATFTPLCSPVCLNESTLSGDIAVKALNYIEIKSFEAKQTENPELINVTFETSSSNAELLIVALYEKNTRADYETLVYFNGFEKSEDDKYTFTIERARLKELIGDTVNNCTLRLTVCANGVFGCPTRETVYNESVYTIMYHLNGGTNNLKNPDVFSVTNNTIIYNPTKEHYNFRGWYDNPYFEGTDIWVIPEGTHGSLELYARWESVPYLVIYRDGVEGAIVFADKVYDVGYGTKTPEFGSAPTREGYTFIGWDKEISKTVECDVVYNAVWEKNHVHEPKMVEGVSGFCFEAGYKSYYECENCGYFEDEGCTSSILNIELWKQTDGKLIQEHIFKEKVRDKAHLVIGSGISCMDALRYYYGCANCEAVSTEEWTSDIYGEHKIDTGFTYSQNQHYHVCLQEGCTYTTKKVDCFGGEATCEQKAICAICKNEYGELAPHTPEEDDGLCTTAQNCTSCGAELTPAENEHKDSDKDGKCDACMYDMPIEPGANPDTDTDTDGDTNTDTDTDTDTDTSTDTSTDLDTDVENSGDSGKEGISRAWLKIAICAVSISLAAACLSAGIVLIKLKAVKKRKG